MGTITNVESSLPGRLAGSTSASVNNASTYVQVAVIEACGLPVLLQLSNAATDTIAEVKVTSGAYVGAHTAGNIVDLAVGTDLNAQTADVISAHPAIGTTPAIAASGVHQLRLGAGPAEFGVYAKKTTANTVLTVTASRMIA